MTVQIMSPQGSQCAASVTLAEKLQRLGWSIVGGLPAARVENAETDMNADEDPAPVEPASGVPAGNASRGEWAAYAESLGHSVEGLKRDEIRDLVAAGE